MCLTRLCKPCKDIHTAITNPPSGELDREILHARLKSVSMRIQYVFWNILATTLLYTFTDSMLMLCIYEKQYYYNVAFHSLQTVSIIAYFIASFRDPGYLDMFQRDSVAIDLDQRENEKDYKYLDVNINYILNNSSYGRNSKSMVENEEIDANYPYDIVAYVPEYNRQITIDPKNAPSQFCWRCKFIRPIRSKHCYECGRCVIKYDHHCPMIGNCVASNNHRFFVFFMSTQTMVALWAYYISLNTLFHLKYNDKTTLIERDGLGWFFRIVLFVALFFVVFVAFGLCGYHIYLGCTNQTTYEMIKPQSVEQYIKDETKRKKRYIKRQKRKQLKNDDIDNKDDDYDSDISSASSRLLQNPQLRKKTNKRNKKRWFNFTDEYRNYFDEGFLGNMWLFLSGKVYPEWRTALPCIVLKNTINIH